jgi:hypothetical protein
MARAIAALSSEESVEAGSVADLLCKEVICVLVGVEDEEVDEEELAKLPFLLPAIIALKSSGEMWPMPDRLGPEDIV